MTRLARLLSLATFVALAGCNNPTPTTVPTLPPGSYGEVPPQTATAPVSGGDAQRFAATMDVPGQWWTLFHSPALNDLVNQALTANPDIAAAQASLRSAQEMYYAQRAAAYPTVSGSYAISRQVVPTFYAPPIASNTSQYVYGLQTASVNVNYVPDVFGNLRYQTLSAAAAADEQRFELEATYLTLTSNVVGAALQEASLRDQIAATHQVIKVDQDLLALTIAQQQNAQASGLDVLNQETALRQAEQTLPPLEKALQQTHDLLARLVGRAPSELHETEFSLASVQLPEDLPLSVPSKLIEQRPDVAAAAESLALASAQAGVAYTNRLPNFLITADVASQALSGLALFGPGTALSTLAAQVSQTFYDHGALKHRQAAAVAAYDAAAAQYRGTVLSGFQNVADTVVAIQTDADELVAANRSYVAAERALKIVRVQQQVGEVSNVAVLNAQQAYEQATLSLVQAQTARYVDTAAMFQALGGGWWNRNDVQ